MINSLSFINYYLYAVTQAPQKKIAREATITAKPIYIIEEDDVVGSTAAAGRHWP